MPFPPSERVVFDHNPLREVICQLQFPTVLRIGSEAPAAFQEALRETYPIYGQQPGAIQLPEEISRIIANLPGGPGFQTSVIHAFSTADGERTITLGSESLAVTERGYARWEELRAEITRACAALRDIYAPAFLTRVGLRYQDLIERGPLGLESVPWSELLHPAVAGVLATEAEIRDDVINLGAAAEFHVADVPGAALRLQYGLAQSPRGEFAFDADFYTTERSEIDGVADILDVFNRNAGNVFRWAIGGRLRNALRPSSVA